MNAESFLKQVSRSRLNAVKKHLEPYDAVIVTGGSSGIGKALIETIATLGGKFKICNISRTEPSFFLDVPNLVNIPCDLRNLEEAAKAVQTVKSILGISENCGQTSKKILLINNSGYGAYGLFPAPSLANNCGMIDLNVRALTYLCGEFASIIAKNGGAIINIASTAAWQPCPYLSVYAATKAYVLSFSLALDYELRKTGALCLCLCPGPTSTNFFIAAGFTDRPLPSNFGHTSEAVAFDTLYALSKRKNLRVVGILNSISARINYFIPRWLSPKLAGYILSKIRAK